MRSIIAKKFVVPFVVFVFVSINAFGIVSSFYGSGHVANAQSVTANAVDFGLTVNNGEVVDIQSSDITSVRWINAAKLEGTFKNGQKVLFEPDNEKGNDQSALRDQRNSGDAMDYSVKGWGCNWSQAHDGSSVDREITQVDLDIDFKPSGVGECQDVGTINNYQTQDSRMSIAYFQWIDSGTIQPVSDFIDDVFKMEDPQAPNIFISTKETGSCRNRILVNPSANTMRYYDLSDQKPGWEGDPPSEAQAGGCKYQDPVKGDDNSDVPPTNNFEYPLAEAAPGARTLAAGTGTLQGGGTEIGSVSGEDNPTCESADFALTWVMCPVINGALDATDWFFRVIIEPYLKINPIQVDSQDFVYQIWSSFRTIGNILLVFGLMFIVFGQAIGGGMVDAYTAKKALPRILIASVLINLSIYIVAIMVDISNVVGMGIGQLITAPLDGRGSFNFQFETSTKIISTVGAFALLITGGLLLKGAFSRGSSGTTGSGTLAFLGQVTAPIMFFIVIPLLVGAISVFGTLILRRGILMFLAIISPVAMALYTLPSTEKYAKQWFSMFVKTLMVYPIIIAIFAIADVLSTVVFNTEDSFASDLVGIVVLFAPLFMIPFAFKFAGGVMGTIYGTLTKSDKFIRGDKHDIHGRYHKTAEKRHEQRKAAIDTAMVRTADGLATRGNPQRGADRIIETRRRRYGRRQQKDYARYYNDEIRNNNIPDSFEEWTKKQRSQQNPPHDPGDPGRDPGNPGRDPGDPGGGGPGTGPTGGVPGGAGYGVGGAQPARQNTTSGQQNSANTGNQPQVNVNVSLNGNPQPTSTSPGGPSRPTVVNVINPTPGTGPSTPPNPVATPPSAGTVITPSSDDNDS